MRDAHRGPKGLRPTTPPAGGTETGVEPTEPHGGAVVRETLPNTVDPSQVLVNLQRTAYVLGGVSKKHVLNQDQQGKLPAPVLFRRRKLWVLSELYEWAKAGCPTRERWEQMKNAAS